jgi:nucleotidyltransferase/DNA polymerase involved in DNA repair
VPLHFPRYMELSRKIMDILRRYDPNMQPGGCDEGYLKCVIPNNYPDLEAEGRVGS